MHKPTRSRHRRAISKQRPSRVDLLLPRRRVADLARATQFERRRRKVKPLAFVVALVFGFASEARRSLSSIGRFLNTVTGLDLVRSAFQKRFSARSVAFLRAVFLAAVTRQAARLGTRLGGQLASFRDVCAIDATVLKLHRLLADRYAATRTNCTQAAAKLHAVLSLSRRTVDRVLITGERVGDRDFLRNLDWIAGRLLLFDLGYYAHQLFAAITAAHGFFLCRLKDSARPTVVRVRCGVARGQRAVGCRLWDFSFADSRPVDLDVKFTADGPVCRLVGVYNRTRGCWHLYVTNLPVDGFTPEELAMAYRLRWEIEMLFKEMKSTHRLDELTSGREEVVLSLLYANLLLLLATRALARLVEERDQRGTRRVSLRILSSYLIQHVKDLAIAILLGGRSLGSRLNSVVAQIGRTCRDPNPQRPSVLACMAR